MRKLRDHVGRSLYIYGLPEDLLKKIEELSVLYDFYWNGWKIDEIKNNVGHLIFWCRNNIYDLKWQDIYLKLKPQKEYRGLYITDICPRFEKLSFNIKGRFLKLLLKKYIITVPYSNNSKYFKETNKIYLSNMFSGESVHFGYIDGYGGYYIIKAEDKLLKDIWKGVRFKKKSEQYGYKNI